jgi:hypothetical protein
MYRKKSIIEIMEIKITKKESENIFFSALCNGLGTIESYYGFQLDYEASDYANAKKKLIIGSYEEILIQILKDGGRLTLVDIEGDGDNNSTINIQDVHERVKNTPHTHLINMLEENDDAETSDVILQTVFFGNVIFG